jgi:dGTPase
MSMMQWQQLFTSDRLGSRNHKVATETRGQFLRDYDKIIFSSAFRRLQNKTQVFPLSSDIFVHNRLTHSLEAASVGRSLARTVGENLFQKYKDNWDKSTADFYRFELSDLIQTACLAHDIGNPPFGHFGEEAIRDFFEDFFKDNDHNLSPKQIADLKKFEGNAQAFRILSTLFQKQGLKLTYTLLASIIKYPVDSLNGFNLDKKLLSYKKSGYFQAESSFFEESMQHLSVKKDTENGFSRHPFVFLVEAADDICYRIIDLEDALNLNIINLEDAKSLLWPLLKFSKLKDYVENEYVKAEHVSNKMALLRATIINLLIEKCSEAFLKHENELLNGTLNKPLLDLLEPDIVTFIKKIDHFSVQQIYNSKLAIEREMRGYRIIKSLLENSVEAMLKPHKAVSKKRIKFLNLNFCGKLYEDLLSILDFITDLTDEQALNLYLSLDGSKN